MERNDSISKCKKCGKDLCVPISDESGYCYFCKEKRNNHNGFIVGVTASLITTFIIAILKFIIHHYNEVIVSFGLGLLAWLISFILELWGWLISFGEFFLSASILGKIGIIYALFCYLLLWRNEFETPYFGFRTNYYVMILSTIIGVIVGYFCNSFVWVLIILALAPILCNFIIATFFFQKKKVSSETDN